MAEDDVGALRETLSAEFGQRLGPLERQVDTTKDQPPIDIEAERYVLTFALLVPAEPHVWLLRPADFFLEKHVLIYAALVQLHQRGEVDALSLRALLRETRPGYEWSAEVATLMDDAMLADLASPATLERHVRRLRVLAVARDVRTLALTLTAEAAHVGLDPQPWVDSVTRRMLTITDRTAAVESAPKHLAHYVQEEVNRLVGGGAPTGLPLPRSFGSLSWLVRRVQPKVYLVAGRPGMGKTSFMMQWAFDTAATGAGIAVCLQWEMEPNEIVIRELARRVGRSADEIDVGRSGEPTRYPSEVVQAGNDLLKIPMVIDHVPGLPAEQIETHVRRLHWEAQKVYGPQPLAMVTLDYVQLIHPEIDRQNQNANIEVVSRGVTLLAGKLRAPVVVGSQFNREAAKRTGGRPSLSDLRGSGALEQDAQCVLALHREATEDHVTEVIVLKQRRGAKGTAYLGWRAATTCFAPSDRKPTLESGMTIENPDALNGIDFGFDEGASAPPGDSADAAADREGFSWAGWDDE